MTAHPPGRSRRRKVLAFVLLGIAVAEVTVAVVGSLVVGLGVGAAVDTFVVTNSVMGLAFPICGVLIAWQRPGNPVGWLLLAEGVGHATTAGLTPVLAAGVDGGWPEPVLRTIATFVYYAWPWSIALCLPLVLLLFPDGRLPGSRWRWLLWVPVLNSPMFVLSVGSEPGGAGFGVDPWLVLTSYQELGALWLAAEIANLATLLVALAALVVRYRRGAERLRRQLLWLALAVVVVVAVVVPWGLFDAGPILILLVIPLIPAAMTVAILRHQLLDIRLVVSRTVLYGLLTGAVVGVYVGLVALSDVVLRTEVGLGTSALATVLIALAFNPVRVRLQRLVDRALYGDRVDPVRAASRVGEQLATAGLGLEAVPAVVCEVLRLPFAALRGAGTEVAAHGIMPETSHTVSLMYGGERVGELVIGVRAGERRLDPTDRAVLELLAVPVAVAMRATALSSAVQRSRQELVAAREEERRRLRRDLHDGLGPALTGAAFQADAARNLLVDDPVRAGQLVDALRAEIAAAIADIRRLVYGLRPPALDEFGLVAALGREAERLAPLVVEIDAADPLPRLPAAVEVAAYRIATEALTNVARHARASRVRLVLRCAADLTVEVSDDGPGTGNGAAWYQGVGLASMTERAAELGGTCTAGPAPGGGGLVRAALPLGGVR